MTGGWTQELAEGYARRVLARVARHAPDLPDKLLAFDVVMPADLLAVNPDAVAGDPYGGSAELDQNLLWRPLPAASRPATPMPGLVAHRRVDTPRPRSRSRRRIRPSRRPAAAAPGPTLARALTPSSGRRKRPCSSLEDSRPLR